MTAAQSAPGDVVMALSLWEPWARLMALGAKVHETRSWATAYRGPLLICAAKRCNRFEMAAWLSEPQFQQALGIGSTPHERRAAIDTFDFGNAVVLVDLQDCIPTEHVIAAGDLPFGDFSAGRYAWVTGNRRRLQPFPVRGRQGLFRVRLPDDLRDYEGIEPPKAEPVGAP